MRFFWRDDWRERLGWYEQHFESTVPVRGEATPSYTHYPLFPDVPRRIHSVIPETKLIYLVRDPIERIVAHWAQTQEDGQRAPLEEALADYDRPDHPLVCASKYATQIEQYLEYFPPEQLLVLDMNELRTRRLETIQETFRFLGVDDHYRSPAFNSQLNTRRDKKAITRSGQLLLDRVFEPVGGTMPVGVRQRAAPVATSAALTKRANASTRGTNRIQDRGPAQAGGRPVPSPDRQGVRIVVDVNQAGGRSSFREGFGFAAISAGVGGVIGVASGILVARLYGINVVGQYALATAPMGIVWFFSTVRERPGLIRALNPLPPRAPEITGIFAAVLAFSVALTALVSIVGAGITYLLFNGPIDQPELVAPALVCLGGYLLIINTGWNLDGAFSAFRAGRQLFWIRLHQAAAFMVFAAAASLIAETVWCLILAMLAAASDVPHPSNRLGAQMDEDHRASVRAQGGTPHTAGDPLVRSQNHAWIAG